MKATAEGAILLYWNSNTNQVYEIDYADALGSNFDGTTTWIPLYTDYPSHGDSTFIADAGNYNLAPEIPHPKYSAGRFYRVRAVEDNTSPSNPLVAIVAPSDGATLTGTVIVQVSSSSPEILSEVRLYIDGEVQRPSDDGTNFVVNTCEWANGGHIVFATAASQSGLEGTANGPVITYGRSVSSYVNANFNNIIHSVGFSQPFFEPALGQTQTVTAVFAAGANWTLQIQDAASTTVRTATGSGNRMIFNWIGTDDNGNDVPDGSYHYILTAQTNGQTYLDSGGSPISSFAESSNPFRASETFAVAPNANCAVPLSLFPPGYDTNGFIIFTTVASGAVPLSATRSLPRRPDGNNVGVPPMANANFPSQTTIVPTRDPIQAVKGQAGSFGICYKTYSTNGFSSLHPATGWPYPLPTRVAIDGQTRTATTTDQKIRENHYIANGFAAEMKSARWKSEFVKKDDQWNATDIK